FMTALVRGRALAAPAGMPIALGSFGYHEQPERDGEGDGDRVAPGAFDAAALSAAGARTPGAGLAPRWHALSAVGVGPRAARGRAVGRLAAARDEAAAELRALGERAPGAAGLRSVRALELVMASECYVFGGGDAAAFVDGRLLPLFSLSSGDPQLDDDEAE